MSILTANRFISTLESSVLITAINRLNQLSQDEFKLKLTSSLSTPSAHDKLSKHLEATFKDFSFNLMSFVSSAYWKNLKIAGNKVKQALDSLSSHSSNIMVKATRTESIEFRS